MVALGIPNKRSQRKKIGTSIGTSIGVRKPIASPTVRLQSVGRADAGSERYFLKFHSCNGHTFSVVTVSAHVTLALIDLLVSELLMGPIPCISSSCSVTCRLKSYSMLLARCMIKGLTFKDSQFEGCESSSFRSKVFYCALSHEYSQSSHAVR